MTPARPLWCSRPTFVTDFRLILPSKGAGPPVYRNGINQRKRDKVDSEPMSGGAGRPRAGGTRPRRVRHCRIGVARRAAADLVRRTGPQRQGPDDEAKEEEEEQEKKLLTGPSAPSEPRSDIRSRNSLWCWHRLMSSVADEADRWLVIKDGLTRSSPRGWAAWSTDA